MTPRATDDKKTNKASEEVFDFAETSDLCDFGYELARPANGPAAPQQTRTQPSK